jgi:hypothetical protein
LWLHFKSDSLSSKSFDEDLHDVLCVAVCVGVTCDHVL